MPNHTTNTVTFNGDQEQVKKLRQHIKGKMEVIDFNTIIPQPENIFLGHLSQEDKIKCAKEGIPNWYDWNNDNWNTKWNAYHQEEISLYEIEFTTAWSYPYPVMEKLAEMFPDIHIHVEIDYESEDGIHIEDYNL